jgi:phthalate 4,5-cis-dihydrodiol dehydrogenase
MVSDTIFLGVAGLGRAFMLTLPGLLKDPRVRLVAAADPRPEARDRFARDFHARTYESVAAMCADPRVQVVYVATPHGLHAEHAIAAARAGKHLLVEKPMALTLQEGHAMVEAARAAGVHLVVGPSHSYDAPVVAARRTIESGAVGEVRLITALAYTDFIYRPRRPDELDDAHGGGAIPSQAAHHVDVARFIAGDRVANVRCHAQAWDPSRGVPGAYAALLAFAGGCVASLTYSGYARFDSDEWCDWVGELGRDKDPADYGRARAALARLGGSAEEAAARMARGYGAAAATRTEDEPHSHEHFGPLIISCERADLRPTPRGLWIYGERERHFEPLPPPPVPRGNVLEELCAAVLQGRKPLHDGPWGLATLQACLAMAQSAREGREIVLAPMG